MGFREGSTTTDDRHEGHAVAVVHGLGDRRALEDHVVQDDAHRGLDLPGRGLKLAPRFRKPSADRREHPAQGGFCNFKHDLVDPASRPFVRPHETDGDAHGPSKPIGP